MRQNKHFTHVTMHKFRKCRVQQTWTAFMRVRACEGVTSDQSRRQFVHRSQMGCGFQLLWAVGWYYPEKERYSVLKKEIHSQKEKNKSNLMGYCTWQGIQKGLSERLTLLLFCFSSDSSWPSGRLWLRVGWMHTTLLSQEGGPTGGSLSSWSSENSSSPSSAGREFRDVATVNTTRHFQQKLCVTF